jgi:hypothetical protein
MLDQPTYFILILYQDGEGILKGASFDPKDPFNCSWIRGIGRQSIKTPGWKQDNPTPLDY